MRWEEGTEWIVQFGSHRNDELRALAIDASTERVYCAGSTMGAVGGEHRGYGDVWMAGISHAGEHEWSTQIGTNREDKVEGLAAGDGHVVAAAGPTATGARRASRGRWTAGEEDGMIRGGQWGRHHDDGGEGVLQAGSEKKDSILGVASDAWLSIFFAAGQTYGHVDDHHDENRVMTTIIGILGWATRGWEPSLGMMEDTCGRGRSVREVRYGRGGRLHKRPVPPVFGVRPGGEVADGSFIGKGDVWVTKHDGKTGEELGEADRLRAGRRPAAMAEYGPGDAVYVAGSTFGAAIVDGSGSEDPASARASPADGMGSSRSSMDERVGSCGPWC